MGSTLREQEGERQQAHAIPCESFVVFFFLQAEYGIRDLVRSRGLGDVYKRQQYRVAAGDTIAVERLDAEAGSQVEIDRVLMVSGAVSYTHLTLPTSDLV